MSGDTSQASAPPRPLAIVRSYADLHRAVRARSAALGMTRAQLDADAGLTDGHAGKILAPDPIKRMGWVSLGRIIAALGLVLIVAEDPVAPPAPADASGDACAGLPTAQHWRHTKGSAWGRRMAARRALKLSPKQRSASARKAAQARWSKHATPPAAAQSSTTQPNSNSD